MNTMLNIHIQCYYFVCEVDRIYYTLNKHNNILKSQIHFILTWKNEFLYLLKTLLNWISYMQGDQMFSEKHSKFSKVYVQDLKNKNWEAEWELKTNWEKKKHQFWTAMVFCTCSNGILQSTIHNTVLQTNIHTLHIY